MSNKVLITGASGFLGYHLIQSALNAQMQVIAAVRKSSNVEHLKNLPIEFCELSYSSADALAKQLEDLNVKNIIHAAGITKAIKQEEYNKINAGYTIQLAQAIEKLNAFDKLIFISSLATCGPLNSFTELITEETQPKPVTAYGRSKLLAETELMKAGFPFTIFRPTAIYGPRDRDIFIMINTLKKGLDPYIGKFKQQLSFIHAADVADIAVKTLFIPSSAQAYNLTDGMNYDRYEFANIAKTILQKKAYRFHIPLSVVKALAFFVETSSRWMNKAAVLNQEKLNELTGKNWACNISKAKNDLNFKPTFNLQTGLDNTIDWYIEYKWI